MGNVGPVAYQILLPTKYGGIHNVFHVSSLGESFRNQQRQVIELDLIKLQPNLM